jgi:squalene-hopene/tetraprenyl-beta-curcumene cyclase
VSTTQRFSRQARIVAVGLLALLLGSIAGAPRAAAAEKTLGPDAKQLAASRERAINFLKASQADDGNWTSGNSAGVTALALTALIESGVAVDDPTVSKGLAALEKFVQKDGGIYHPSTSHKNYETCVALVAFKVANKSGKFDSILAKADKFLRGLQWDEEEGIQTGDVRYGGADYGPVKKRPDLSNTQFLIEALKTAGAKEDDPNIQKALIFISRCQNLESQHNTTPFASKVNDGGFFYTIAAGGSSPAGTTANGGLRSYGSMTYAGLKSMIYAGLTSSDPRVKAAFNWIRNHYTVTENPGMGPNGLFYYYQTFAKALSVMKLGELDDAQGQKHDWRKELADQLFAVQQSNGSWLNPRGPRWLEGDPNLDTSYALLALHYCEPTAETAK